MKCYRKNGSDVRTDDRHARRFRPSMKCYRKNGSDNGHRGQEGVDEAPQ